MTVAEIAVELPDGSVLQVPKGTAVLDVARHLPQDPRFPILGAFVNNKFHSLKYPLLRPFRLDFVTYRDSFGTEIYRRTCCMILARAVMERRTNTRLVIGHSLGNGYYYDYYLDVPVSARVIEAVEAKMAEIVTADEAVERRVVNCEEAIELFTELGYSDKLRLLKHAKLDKLAIYSCGRFIDIGHGPMAPSTSYITEFKLRPYHNGFILCFPEPSDMQVHLDARTKTKLFHVYHESKKWGKILEVNNVGRFNEITASGGTSELIKVSEALHEKKISQIADEIYGKRQQAKLILVSGPSSSGKTTFTKRLHIQLRVCGLRPVALSLDNYFIDRDKCIDCNGNADFESLDVLDTPLFNAQLSDLLAGRRVDIPKFDFIHGKRTDQTTPMELDEDNILMVEGIHGLNDALTSSVHRDAKFKIYVSALTQLSIDDYNRIPTTDVRLMRRMVRDNKFRGYSAAQTLARWPSVRRGEERYIFPFQEEADAMFNSALVYELAVLKGLSMPLLERIERTDEMYSESRRLMRFLTLFRTIPTNEIPSTSILREFVGGSGFRY